MLYRQTIDKLTAINNASPGTLSAATTIQYRIPQQSRRLEALIVHLTATTSGTAGANVQDGMPGIIKEIRLRVEDVVGPRNVVQCTGPALLSYMRNLFGFVDRYTAQGYKTAQLSASTAYQMAVYVPLRHPVVQEPFANVLSLPLSNKFLRGDPLLEIDLRAYTEAFAQALASVAVNVWAVYREIPDTMVYIPSEWRTDRWAPGVAAQATWDFPTKGYLTGCLVQGYSSGTYASSVTRVALLSSGGTIELKYGREIIRTFNELLAQAMNDWSQWQCPIDTTNDDQVMAGEWLLDLMSDHPGSDAYSIGSILNLEPVALRGDKLSLAVKDWANSAYVANLTTHRLFPVQPDDLKALTVGI